MKNLDIIRIPVNPGNEYLEQIPTPDKYDTVIVISYDAFRHEGQRVLQEKLLDTGIPVMQVIAGNPADIQVLPETSCRVVTLGSHMILMEQAFRVLGLLPPSSY